MDYPDDHHPHHQPPSQEYVYPDIDETIHYPWQGNQPTTQGEASIHSVLDPRLYKDLFTGNASQAQDEASLDEDAEAYHDADDSDESLYTLSSEESSSEEEFSNQADEDDEAYGRRRRRGTGPFSGRYGARGGKGIRRGPRKPLEPSPEFKILHSEATSAFIDGDYDRAIDLTKRAIQVNPEMFAAHSLLSEIFLAQGEKDKALTALFSGAHTRPKDPTVWAKVARMILERAGEERQGALNDVIYCYSRIIELDPKNYNARFQRAAIYRELGYNGRAATEYERILKEVPHNARALRHLAETYIDLNDVQKAVDQWRVSVKYFTSLEPEDAPEFSWSDVNIYAELYSYLGRPFEGLKALKSVSRWLLGRKDDTMWEDFHEDDREWDADDSPRRIKADGYEPRRWPRDSYGLGLPLELRIKLALFRLRMGYEHKNEALHHLEWLNPEDTSEHARLYDYGDLFREAADALKDVGLFEEALRFYMPLQQTNEYADVGFFMAMGECCSVLGKLEDAENCFLTVAEHDARHVESRVQLAKLYEGIGMSEEALKYVNEAVLLGRQESRSNRRRKDTRLEQLAVEFKAADAAREDAALRSIAPQPPSADLPAALTTTTTSAAKDTEINEEQRIANVQYLYDKLMQLLPQAKEGNAEATEDWLDIADALLREFRSNRVFYPIQRNITFLGYSREAQRKAGRHKGRNFIDEMQEMAGRLQESLGSIPDEPLQGAIPTDYYGISFNEWLDLFLQYALTVATQGESDEAYDTLAAAADASVWYHSKADTRMIHVCWFTCALRMQDEETLANEARWFIKEYQFVTDTYRLFAMLSRLVGDPHRSLFHSSPNMKFMLRQIKAMDFTVPDEVTGERPNRFVRESAYKERASLSTRDETTGEAIPADEMDVALLVLYGHILYSGNSFYPALNYLFRAYALDDQNPAVLLSIALCYIHHSLKRQSENRHYLIMQGLSFMQEYRRVRERPGSLLSERQEMEFNFARVWHSLGIAHLAIEGYQLVLDLGAQIQAQSQQTIPHPKDGSDVVMGDTGLEAQAPFVEDFSREAAVALQIIYALNGDYQSAQKVTAKWLVI
ncbi:RNA polymerase III transcription factor TFIIIC subunit [Aspergillus niger ATCC 13496]|uniref:RNA polymerase III transcription factor TFIIIC subunit n=1 Tax=Aspergillus niger ATCC 13496 TaxID=1353008 RepID=A0A370BJH2_ASPNG|nr:RNA polymerase III transcription factor TFIIIC subunit (Tfc4) [Aspergillus niger CBS 513.88]RDH14245.1 RNA polymerase III transcription factor TFIIIC subunit [Aspergillus niger ATCC 13496]|eukprot:XP_001388834.2 RNA polymerase III transcription factor TFIIIC subunit (Tfc4) [Aspergillus niger CBS 513.88]